MKHLLGLILLFTLGVLLSCSSDTGDPAVDESTLIVEPDTLMLTAVDSVKVLDLVLSCGCNFTLQISSASGDTASIKYEPVTSMGEKLAKHTIRFRCSPGIGSAMIKLDFLATKVSSTYRNSVIVATQ